ncbi:MAG: MBL fold metallo-hydrolase [Clostridia bacterium]|nr:MBL fold metallo-hydrolase [Clostridia bacterium]
MQIITIAPIGFASNCYLLSEDGKNAVAIDPAQPRILKEAARRGFAVKYVLLTHGHFDHIGGCAALQKAGAKIGCMEIEKALALGESNMGWKFGAFVPPFDIDFTLNNGDVLELCGIPLSVMGTPGHTAGGCCYVLRNKKGSSFCEEEGSLFTGDTLFAGDVGRTDLPTGSEGALRESLQRLIALKGNYTVYPGHGASTTLERERRRLKESL